MAKFINKQAICQTVGGQLDYVSPEQAQIRAFTVHNPTSDSIECTVTANGKVFAKRTILANSSEMFTQLFNQQIGKDERLSITGDGLNVWVSVVEIVE